MLPTPGSSAFLRERLLFDLIFVPFRSQQVSGTGLWADSATSVWSLLPHPWTILSDPGSSLSWSISPSLSGKPPVLVHQLLLNQIRIQLRLKLRPDTLDLIDKSF